MNQELIKRIIKKGNIETATHSGSYELMQKSVEFYAGLDSDKITLADLTMLFRFSINRGNKQPLLDEKIDECNLSTEKKETLKGICKKWNYENLGVFGSGSMVLQFSKKADKDAIAQRFIKMLIDVSKLTNDKAYEMFEIVRDALSSGISGIRAGIASQILHYLNPEVFAVLNNVGQEGYEKKLGLTGFNKISEVSTYAENARKLYEFREQHLPGINFRTIDVVFWEYQEDEPTKFKRLLNWFVSNLTRNLNIELDDKPLVGKGDNGTDRGAPFRRNYNEWRVLGDVELDVTLGRGRDISNPKAHYVHVTNTYISIYPIFDEKKTTVMSLQIGIHKNTDGFDPISIDALGIMTEGSPNNELIAFFESFKSAAKMYADQTTKTAELPSEDITYWLGGANISVGDISQDCITGGFYAINYINKDLKSIIGDTEKLAEVFDKHELSKNAREMFNLFFQIKAGDKIAIKSTYAYGKDSRLRIKAIGTVKAAASDAYKYDSKCGHTIPVNWESTDVFDLDNIGFYSVTISKLTKTEHIKRIFFGESDEIEMNLVDYKGENIILYGVPGSGKSFSVKKEIAELLSIDPKNAEAVEQNYIGLSTNEPQQIVRVVFHPDYTYSDFTGQILPKTKMVIEGGEQRTKVDYQFTPGPFTRILKSAIQDSQNPYFLVVEEINRGNASAIFGDLFQLLDRKADGSSEYPVSNNEIGKVVEGITDEATLPKDIFLPSNLWIIATMNTSDQNVFTLDTAFQRRWDMRLIFNRFTAAKDGRVNHDFIIEGTGITWRVFAKTINSRLEGGSMTSEDKRLGAWFIKPDEDDGRTVSKRRFANKVLKYLWDDAFKFSRDSLFNTQDHSTLEKVVSYFIEKVKGGQGFGNLFAGDLFLTNEIEKKESAEE